MVDTISSIACGPCRQSNEQISSKISLLLAGLIAPTLSLDKRAPPAKLSTERDHVVSLSLLSRACFQNVRVSKGHSGVLKEYTGAFGGRHGISNLWIFLNEIESDIEDLVGI